jgi:hypothetical protein
MDVSSFFLGPTTTLANITCRPSSHGVCTVAVVMNCVPLVPGPALAAQERSGVVRGWGGRSEISLRLIDGSGCSL